MSFVIDGVDFKDMDAERYWTFPKSFKGDPKVETQNMIFSGDYLGARKMDGAYYRFIKNVNGEMRLQGRSKSVSGDYLDKLDHVPQLKKFFDWLPKGTCLVGEIYFPNNEGSSNVTKIMGCLTDKAVARQQRGDKLWYYVFDVYALGGTSMMETPIEKRAQAIQMMAENWGEVYSSNGLDNFVKFAAYHSGRELWNRLQWILANGGEGIVMTRKGTVPSPGKRTARKTLKVKKELQENIDCFFTGRATAPTRLYSGKELETWGYWEDLRTGARLEGQLYEDYHNGMPIDPITKPYFYNWAGSLEIAVLKDGAVTPIGSLSGLSDDIKANFKSYKGKCIEVAAMEILPDTHALRHGKMMRFRPDLNVEDCTWEKAFG